MVFAEQARANTEATESLRYKNQQQQKQGAHCQNRKEQKQKRTGSAHAAINHELCIIGSMPSMKSLLLSCVQIQLQDTAAAITVQSRAA